MSSVARCLVVCCPLRFVIPSEPSTVSDILKQLSLGFFFFLEGGGGGGEESENNNERDVKVAALVRDDVTEQLSLVSP